MIVTISLKHAEQTFGPSVTKFDLPENTLMKMKAYDGDEHTYVSWRQEKDAFHFYTDNTKTGVGSLTGCAMVRKSYPKGTILTFTQE